MPEPVTILAASSGAVAAAKKVDDGLGLIAKMLGKLKANPDLAAQKLSQALEELAKTYQVLDAAISSYLSLGIDDGALAKNSKLLLDIEGGQLATEVERGRGHCEIIHNIYNKYLDKWFDRALKDKHEYELIRDVFNSLASADADVFANLTIVAKGLETEAGQVLNLVTNERTDFARQRILGARGVLKTLRVAIAETMQTLYKLKAEFIEISDIV